MWAGLALGTSLAHQKHCSTVRVSPCKGVSLGSGDSVPETPLLPQAPLLAFPSFLVLSSLDLL
jgi:hypothetical protein